MTEDALTIEARQFLHELANQPFDECFPLLKTLAALPKRAGIYAIRHREAGILYIGKSLDLRQRFMDGHKALYCCYIDRFAPESIRIAIVLVRDEQRRRMLDIEARMIQITKPRYNSVIRQRED
jgi:excinuclease UvrABC nuclease subunit